MVQQMQPPGTGQFEGQTTSQETTRQGGRTSQMSHHGGQTDQSQGMQTGRMQSGQTGGQTGLRLQDVETPQQQAAADAVAQAIRVCGWCADQCIQLADPHMVECVRRCEDVVELGETGLALLPRNSAQTPTVMRAFEQAAEACARECAQHQHAHCQECAQVLPWAADAARQLAQSFGQQGGQTQGGQMQSGQMQSGQTQGEPAGQRSTQVGQQSTQIGQTGQQTPGTQMSGQF